MGRPADAKHREAVFQRLSSLILREGSDMARLDAVANRALHDREVAEDPQLGAMLRSLIADRRQTLAREQLRLHPELAERSELRSGFQHLEKFPTRERILSDLLHHEREFLTHLHAFDVAAAQGDLERMRGLQTRFPVHVTSECIERHAVALQEMQRRAEDFRRSIDELADRGALAAQVGNQKVAAWVIKRLQAVHALRPRLLSEACVKRQITAIMDAARENDRIDAVEELRAREKAVADEIRRISAAIHAFHAIARTHAPDSGEFRAAEQEYQTAVRQVQRMDSDWLADLIVELESVIEDLHAPTDPVRLQLDQFITSVRRALSQIVGEIREIQSGQR